MSLLVVGSVAFDSVKTPYGSVDRVLAGAGTYFSVAASFFTDVRIVAVVGEDFTAKEEKLFLNRGIDISGIAHAKGKSFFWAGEYGENVNDAKTLDTQLGVFADFPGKDNVVGGEGGSIMPGHAGTDLVSHFHLAVRRDLPGAFVDRGEL